MQENLLEKSQLTSCVGSSAPIGPRSMSMSMSIAESVALAVVFKCAKACEGRANTAMMRDRDRCERKVFR